MKVNGRWISIVFLYLWQFYRKDGSETNIRGRDMNKKILNEVGAFIRRSRAEGDSIVVMGDTNGRLGELVGDAKMNKAGEMWYEFCLQNNLIILNGSPLSSGASETWTNGRFSSIIDYCAVSEQDEQFQVRRFV